MSRIVYSVREGHFVAPLKWKYKDSQFHEELLDIPLLEKYKNIYNNSSLHPTFDRQKLKEAFDKEILHSEYCPRKNHKKCPRKISNLGFYIIKTYHKEFIKIIKIKNDNKNLYKSLGKEIDKRDHPQQLQKKKKEK
tara:strand:- start:2882 stop:3289 length:408 start_codon:yes stop_codon:yes gene_type:complete